MLKLKHKFLVLTIFMVAGFILNGNANADSEKRRTNTGAVFTRNTSHDKLGEAWRDPDGLIWGDIVKNEDGSVREMVQSSEHMKERGNPLPEGTLGAKEYCESIGARLPSKYDFTKLQEFLGYGSRDEKYSAQVLPNLSGYRFWSLWIDKKSAFLAYVFDGTYGYFPLEDRKDNYAVRCVAGL